MLGMTSASEIFQRKTNEYLKSVINAHENEIMMTEKTKKK